MDVWYYEKLVAFKKCYLTDRHQCVVVDCEISRWLPVSSGVPQGSALGPILFIVYINDLLSALTSFVPYLLANDTKCCKPITSFNDVLSLQTDLNNLSKWCHKNKLPFNNSKSCLLSFSNRVRNVTYTDNTINGSGIVYQDHCRDLGVIFSSDLSGTEHLNFITAKAYHILGIIRRTFSSSVPTRVKYLLFFH